MKNKIIEFIKKDKDFLLGSYFLIISYLFTLYHTSIFKIYNIDLKHRLFIFISIYFEIYFFEEGLKIVVQKTKK